MSKKTVVERSLYGNNNVDFNDALLPKTRKAQFGYILKNNWLKLFYVNMIIFIFFIPAILYGFIKTINYNNLIKDMTQQQIFDGLFEMNLVRYLVFSLLLMLGFVGLSGGSFIIRKLIFDEVVTIKSDFLKGIKYSAKQFMLFGLFFGLTTFAFDYSIRYLSYLKINPLFQIMLMVMICIITVVLIISIMYMMNLSNLYVMKMGDIIKYGLLLSFKHFFKNIGLALIAFVPVFIWGVVTHITFMLIPVLLLFIFGFVYILLLFSLMAMYSFDKFINPTQYPEYVRKGLSRNE